MDERVIKIIMGVVISLLVFLACSSGVTKILLMEQDAVFFGKYGFSSAMLIGFGIVQLMAGLMIILPRTRFIGAGLVALTFVVSLVMLVMEGSIGFSLVTLLALVLLGWVMSRSRAA